MLNRKIVMAPQIYARDFGYRHSSRLKHALQGLNFEVERGNASSYSEHRVQENLRYFQLWQVC